VLLESLGKSRRAPVAAQQADIGDEVSGIGEEFLGPFHPPHQNLLAIGRFFIGEQVAKASWGDARARGRLHLGEVGVLETAIEREMDPARWR
jgi:hypothetical protein